MIDIISSCPMNTYLYVGRMCMVKSDTIVMVHYDKNQKVISYGLYKKKESSTQYDYIQTIVMRIRTYI